MRRPSRAFGHKPTRQLTLIEHTRVHKPGPRLSLPAALKRGNPKSKMLR